MTFYLKIKWCLIRCENGTLKEEETLVLEIIVRLNLRFTDFYGILCDEGIKNTTIRTKDNPIVLKTTEKFYLSLDISYTMIFVMC